MGKWLAVSPKNTSLFKLVCVGFQEPGTHGQLEYSTSWKGPAPSGFIIKSCQILNLQDLPEENWNQVLCTAGKPKKLLAKKHSRARWHPYSSLKASFLFLARLHKDSKRRAFRIAWCLWSPQRNQRLPKHWTLRRGCFFPKQRVPWPNCMACIILGSNNQQNAKIIDARKNVGIMWDFSKQKVFVLEASFTTNRLIAQRIFLQHSLLSRAQSPGFART